MNAPAFKDLVFVGGGHSHALVLRMWAMKPLPGVRLTLISPQSMTPYSGMLPGLVAGHYGFEQTHIDLPRLCDWAGVRWIQDEVTAIDPERRRLSLAGRPDLEYDLVSIDIGSTPDRSIPGSRQYSTPVKPISDFHARWERIRAQAREGATGSIAVVGGGAGSVEIVLSMAHRLREQGSPLRLSLVTAAGTLLKGYSRSVRRRVRQALESQGIEVLRGFRVARVEAGRLIAEDGREHRADELIWCTQAGAAEWIAASGLRCDARGFLSVRPTLQALEHDDLFAAGDIADMVRTPRPKAGVYAVRQAPVLFHNLRARLLGEPLRDYRPQDGFLSLLALGGKTATGMKPLPGGLSLSVSGDWVWRWKDRIDRTFMRQFHELPPMTMPRCGAEVDTRLIDAEERGQEHDPAVRCAGCGGKIGADVLRQVVQAISGQAYRPEDVVALDDTPQRLFQSVDAIRAPLDDPWLFGRIATLHALGDLQASGLRAHSAQVLVSLPHAGERLQRRELLALMQGVLRELDAAGCRFLGGHSAEGAELSLGLALQGVEGEGGWLAQSGMRPGDRLLLGKPLGSGVLLAAAMQARTSGRWRERLIEGLLHSNATAADALQAVGAHACTDVTGFGLFGHLLEMCQASGCDAVLRLEGIPLYPGALELSRQGLRSSLYPHNRRADRAMVMDAVTVDEDRLALLFDPQTCGGLLASVPAAIAEDPALAKVGFVTVGEVLPASGAEPLIRIR